jgi:uncharacterized protein
MLSTEIPLFPLPNVVLFPGVFLPLHVFEARYRAMMGDVLAGDRLICIVLLKPGWHQETRGFPDTFGIGCCGLVTHVEQLDDGRYNIILRGIEKLRITGEQDGKPYRVASVEAIHENMTSADHENVRQQRSRLEHLLSLTDVPDVPFPSSLSDEEVVNALAQYLEFDPLERQALLERSGVADRCAGLIDLLEMRSMMGSRSPDRGLWH